MCGPAWVLVGHHSEREACTRRALTVKGVAGDLYHKLAGESRSTALLYLSNVVRMVFIINYFMITVNKRPS